MSVGLLGAPAGDLVDDPMLLTEIDHVAIAVRDLEAAIAYYARGVRCQVDHREIVDSDGVEEALIKVADSYIQLLRPRGRTRRSPSRSRSAARACTTSATAWTTAPPRSAAMVAAGATPIDKAPRPGSRGTTVAFVHPKGSFGTLIELVQE